MKQAIYLVALLCFIAWPATGANAISEADVEKALTKLDKTLDKRGLFIELRQKHIDSLVSKCGNLDNASLLLEVVDCYTSFNTDSALKYLNRGIETTSGASQYPFRWRRAVLLPLAGYIEAAAREFSIIPPDSVPQELKYSYFNAGRQMHSYIASFLNAFPERRQQHLDSALTYQQRIISTLPPGSKKHTYHLAEYYFQSGRPRIAEAIFENLLDSLPTTSNLRARAAHHLATIARGRGDNRLSLYYLAESAHSDIEAATREILSLQELGAQLPNNQIDRSYRYVSTALSSSVECGAALRTIDTSQGLAVIEEAHNASIDRFRKRTYTAIAMMALLVIGLIATLVFIYYEIVKMKRLQQSLRQANKVKEIYISQFLQLCSIYMYKLNQFSKIVTRKLSTGQVDDLYRMTKSGKFVEEQSQEFYNVFDNAFLHLYPDFIERVNELLRPDCQIELQPGEILNTDLRILAFMRLGIHESSQIAQVLNYSINTIYSYRNRLKSRAISRDTFEERIASIGSSK